MVSWSGSRKTLTILLFLLPTIIGLLIFNVYPIILNTYISFTNRNKFRPNPDCNVTMTGLLDPLCWPAFKDKAPVGLGNPYKTVSPIFKNYTDLVGSLFTGPALLALLQIFICFIPLIAAVQYDHYLDKQLTRSIPTLLLWFAGLLLGGVLVYVLQVPKQIKVLMDTGDFLVVVFRTILFVILRVPFTFALGLALALLINLSYIKGKTLFRVFLFVPWAASSVSILVALIWQFFFREQGTINQVMLALFNIKGPIWLNDPVTAFGAIILVDIWLSYPFFMMVILGSLQSIPVDQYEAAEVDGANFWHQLLNITLPGIRPAVLPATVLTSISAFQMFGTAWAITTGGPIVSADKPGATEFVMVYAYKQIFQTQNYGRATAFAVIIFIMLFAATLWSLRMTRITKSAYES